MNKLEQKLREYVEKEAENFEIENISNMPYRESFVFKAGAELFLPILVEALGALAMVQQYSKVESDKCGHQAYVNKALKSIDKKLGSIE